MISSVFAYKFGIKPLTKSAKVQGVAGAARYTLRDVIGEAKKMMKISMTKENRKQLGLDIQALTVLAKSLEDAELPADGGGAVRMVSSR